MVKEELLEILVCPRCKGKLEYRTEPEEVLICRACKLAYPVKDDIPVMLPDEAKPLED
ncbi:Trm112 family protein [bacterium]|nr:MAG: Trm112 family protein [bacterium]